MAKEVAVTAKAPKETPKVSFNLHIPKEAKLDVDLSGLELGQKKDVTISGKVQSVSLDEYGNSFGMDVSGLKFGGSKPSSLIEDSKKLKNFRTQKGNEETNEED